jgi:hypothetical protein
MKIAVIGSGNVGGVLGKGWARKGHDVTFGVRNTSDPKIKQLLAAAEGKAHAGSVKDAAAGAEVIAISVPWDAAQDAVKNAGNLRGKIVLDCTNPLKPDLSGLTHGYDTSGAEQIAKWAAGARVVKIFNTTGFGNMTNPVYPEGASMMVYCGNDTAAKICAAQLATDLGFAAYDLGPLTEARLLEPLALIWIKLAVQKKMGLNFVFRLVRR